MTPLLAAVTGAVAGFGALMVVMALTAPDLLRVPTPSGVAVSDRRRAVLVRAGLGAGAAVVTWWVTTWPVGAALAATAAAAVPSMVGAKARRNAAVARIEAIATWAEQLRDVMAAADGIQSAIRVTAATAPAPIRPEVRRLADRLAQRERLSDALVSFAEEVSHPLADMIVTSLLLASERQGRLGDLLTEVATSARATASMRMRVEAVRARTYVTTRLIVGLTAAITVWLVVMRREYLEPFDGVAGQFMLGVIGAVFAGSAVAMAQMARPAEAPRLLVTAGEGAR